MPEKRFLVKDHSGRGFAVTLPISDVRERWDRNFKNDPDDEWEETLGDWLESADVGDTFTNTEDKCSFTRTD